MGVGWLSSIFAVVKAAQSYQLKYLEPSGRSRWMRRAFVAVMGVVSLGERVAPGGGQIGIFDRLTGRMRGSVSVSFGDDGFTWASLEEDLLTLNKEEFAAKWMADLPDDG